uniref:Uncharacterized protein n=1 Tax=Octopus bimaculoides TaxID=37653 RepID=A0A0L8G8R9_OCTBM
MEKFLEDITGAQSSITSLIKSRAKKNKTASAGHQSRGWREEVLWRAEGLRNERRKVGETEREREKERERERKRKREKERERTKKQRDWRLKDRERQREIKRQGKASKGGKRE